MHVYITIATCEIAQHKCSWVKVNQEVVTKNRIGMDRNELFCSILFRTLRLEAILVPRPKPNNFDFGIPNPKSKYLGK